MSEVVVSKASEAGFSGGEGRKHSRHAKKCPAINL